MEREELAEVGLYLKKGPVPLNGEKVPRHGMTFLGHVILSKWGENCEIRGR
jgi:hypothetical protein